jgi:hypothetical protein
MPGVIYPSIMIGTNTDNTSLFRCKMMGDPIGLHRYIIVRERERYVDCKVFEDELCTSAEFRKHTTKNLRDIGTSIGFTRSAFSQEEHANLNHVGRGGTHRLMPFSHFCLFMLSDPNKKKFLRLPSAKHGFGIGFPTCPVQTRITGGIWCAQPTKLLLCCP